MSSLRKRALLVTFSYPPLIGPGGVRPSKLKKYLPKYGWDVDVLTVGSDHFPVDADTQVFRAKCKSFLGRQKHLMISTDDKVESAKSKTTKLPLKSRLRRKLGWQGFCSVHYPDLEEGWVKNAYQTGCALVEQNNYDAIISSFPPVASHRVAAKLARKYDLPWLADYRDEWSSEDYYMPRKGFLRIIDQLLEKKTIKLADHIVTISDPIAKALESMHNKTVDVIPNGFDPDDYPHCKGINKSGKFTITFTGHLNKKNYIEPLFKAAQKLIAEQKNISDILCLQFVGCQRASLQDEIDYFNINSVARTFGWFDYFESLSMQIQSTVLLFPFWDADGAAGVLSSKFFTYLGARRPILFIGPSHHIIDDILQKTQAGRTVPDSSSCKAVLEEWIEEWRETGDIQMNRNEEEIAKYSRQYQAGQFAEILNSVVEKV